MDLAAKKAELQQMYRHTPFVAACAAGCRNLSFFNYITLHIQDGLTDKEKLN